eukprot:2517168-Amphidinium_carterae.2
MKNTSFPEVETVFQFGLQAVSTTQPTVHRSVAMLAQSHCRLKTKAHRGSQSSAKPCKSPFRAAAKHVLANPGSVWCPASLRPSGPCGKFRLRHWIGGVPEGPVLCPE